jgi:hypothetical protein
MRAGENRVHIDTNWVDEAVINSTARCHDV